MCTIFLLISALSGIHVDAVRGKIFSFRTKSGAFAGTETDSQDLSSRVFGHKRENCAHGRKRDALGLRLAHKLFTRRACTAALRSCIVQRNKLLHTKNQVLRSMTCVARQEIHEPNA